MGIFCYGGGGEIRTLESVRTAVFKTAGISHYPTPPYFYRSAERVGFEPTGHLRGAG